MQNPCDNTGKKFFFNLAPKVAKETGVGKYREDGAISPSLAPQF